MTEPSITPARQPPGHNPKQLDWGRKVADRIRSYMSEESTIRIVAWYTEIADGVMIAIEIPL